MNSVDVVDVLARQGVGAIYHAHNLIDARVYLRERAILSREHLLQHPEATRFFTDDRDRELGVLGSVFFNLRDMGLACKKGNGIPNAYGPINFVFRPVALNEANETTVSRVPISQLSGNTLMEVTEPEVFTAAFQDNPTHWLRRENENIELICRSTRITFDSLSYVLVDPIQCNGQNLVDIVRAETHQSLNAGVIVQEREFSEDGHQVFDSLMAWIEGSQGKLSNLQAQPQRIQTLYNRQGRTRMLSYAGSIWTNTMRYT